MSGPGPQRIGGIGLDELAEVSRLRGLEGLPYPFARTEVGATDRDRRATVAGRLRGGDLSVFGAWADAYVDADIWVTCRVHHRDAAIPGRRVLAYRTGETGYVAQQHRSSAVEIFEMAATELAGAVSAAVGLTNPGARPAVVVPGYVGYFAPSEADFDHEADDVTSVRVAVQDTGSPHTEVPDDAVTAITTIQSRWRPPRRWGVDWTGAVIAAIHLDGDGDYAYTEDFGHALPVTTHQLAERIDALIADDLSELRRRRGTGPDT